MNPTKLILRLKRVKLIRKLYYKATVSPWYYYAKYAWFRSSSQLWLSQINFEFCSNCNLRCKWCPVDHSKPPEHMDVGLFERLIHDIATKPSYHIKAVHLHNGGETLLHPRFAEMMEILGNVKRKHHKFPLVTLLTNATPLNERKISAIVDNKAVDVMRFSVDGGNKDAFEEIRRGATWPNVLRRINAFMDYNAAAGKPCMTAVFSIIDPAAEKAPEFERLIERCDDYQPRRPHTFDGSKDLGLGQQGEQPKGFCCFVLDQMVVLPSGKVTACCADLYRHIAIGDANKESLYQIYKGKRRRKIIECMRAHKRRTIPLCKDCYSR